MTQENKELLIRDLCARVPYGVKYMRYSWNYDIDQELPVIETLECVDKDGYINHRRVYTVDDIKPYLFPLSSMTEEQIEELKELCNMYTPPDDDYHPYAYKGIRVLYKHVLDGNYKFYNFKTDVTDWFNKNHFDYQGLIPMGSAIDATGLNIY